MSLFSQVKAYLLENSTATNNPTSTTAPIVDDPPKCRFRLDTDSSDTLILPDGRKLGYAQYGSLTGKPILYQHGLPGSRLEAATYHDLGLELGARIISTDRPGIGWSSPHPNRKLLDHPKDLEHLANHLGLESYSVLGVSGGGPYALACAAALPSEKLKCVSIVCGLGPPDIGMSGAGFVHRVGFPYGIRYAPRWLVSSWYKRELVGRLDLSDEERLKLFLASASKAHETERDIYTDADFWRLVIRSSREAFAQGYDAVSEDAKVMCDDFGFRVQDIRKDLPVQLWYGKHDTFVPANHGVQIAARLGGRAQLRVEDEGHAGIGIHWKKEILEGLLRNM